MKNENEVYDAYLRCMARDNQNYVNGYKIFELFVANKTQEITRDQIYRKLGYKQQCHEFLEAYNTFIDIIDSASMKGSPRFPYSVKITIDDKGIATVRLVEDRNA
jgi:hypothetical protein